MSFEHSPRDGGGKYERCAEDQRGEVEMLRECYNSENQF